MINFLVNLMLTSLIQTGLKVVLKTVINGQSREGLQCHNG